MGLKSTSEVSRGFAGGNSEIPLYDARTLARDGQNYFLATWFESPGRSDLRASGRSRAAPQLHKGPL